MVGVTIWSPLIYPHPPRMVTPINYTFSFYISHKYTSYTLPIWNAPQCGHKYSLNSILCLSVIAFARPCASFISHIFFFIPLVLLKQLPILNHLTTMWTFINFILWVTFHFNGFYGGRVYIWEVFFN